MPKKSRMARNDRREKTQPNTVWLVLKGAAKSKKAVPPPRKVPPTGKDSPDFLGGMTDGASTSPVENPPFQKKRSPRERKANGGKKKRGKKRAGPGGVLFSQWWEEENVLKATLEKKI